MSRAAVLFGSDSAANVAFLRAAEAVAPSLAVKLAAIDVRSRRGDRASGCPRSPANRTAACSSCRTPTTRRTADRLLYWRRGIACRRSIRSGTSRQRAG